MFTKIKSKWQLSGVGDFCRNIRRHKILFTLIAVLAFICYKMFMSNYLVQPPIVKKDEWINPIDLHNQLAACNQNLDFDEAAIHQNNLAATSDIK